jgi:nucleotide-binding universal stress UspA family protein
LFEHTGTSEEVTAMWERLLLAIDQFESGQTALKFTAGLAAANGADGKVIHIREVSRWARIPPLETPTDASHLVDQAAVSLRLAGISADGRASSLPEDLVERRILEESMSWICDAIVMGTRRLHGISHLSGRGVRETVFRLSVLPVIAVPTRLNNVIVSPRKFRDSPADTLAPAPRNQEPVSDTELLGWND